MSKIWDLTLLPDGRLLYTLPEIGAGSACNYWVMPLEETTGAPTGNPVRLTNLGGTCMYDTSVSADGKKLIFINWASHSTVNIADLEANPAHLVNFRHFAPSESWDSPADWTRDSQELIFLSKRNGYTGIYKQSLNGDAAEPLVTGSQDAADARVSPDGLCVVYFVSTFEDTRAPLEIMRVPVTGGLSQRVLTMRPFSDFRCARSPSTLCVVNELADDRKQFIMTAFDPLKGRGRELARIAIDSEPRKFHWDLSPDGTRISVSKNAEGPIEILSLLDYSTRTLPVKGWRNLQTLDWAADGKSLFPKASMGASQFCMWICKATHTSSGRIREVP
jgi:Tol biopolymer transport system component